MKSSTQPTETQTTSIPAKAEDAEALRRRRAQIAAYI
jgi:hypothetical protein